METESACIDGANRSIGSPHRAVVDYGVDQWRGGPGRHGYDWPHFAWPGAVDAATAVAGAAESSAGAAAESSADGARLGSSAPASLVDVGTPEFASDLPPVAKEHSGPTPEKNIRSQRLPSYTRSRCAWPRVCKS